MFNKEIWGLMSFAIWEERNRCAMEGVLGDKKWFNRLSYVYGSGSES